MQLVLRAALLAGACAAGFGTTAAAEILEQILVKVNGEILTKTELEQRQIALLRQRNPQLLQDDAGLKRALAEITPQLLVDTIDEMLLMQRGRELGYRLSDEQFRGILDNIKKENKLETEEQFQAALKQEGMTLDELRRSIETRMLIDRVQQLEVIQKVGITEDEAKKYYSEHPTEFTTASAVTLREILIGVPDATAGGERGVNVGQDDAAREKAEAAHARLSAGEDFAKVAADVSDAASKANGGLIGPVSRSELAPALAKVLDGLKPGEITQPIRGARGYQIIKLETASESALQPFDQVRDSIADKVFNEKRRGELEKYLKRLRAQAIIEWKSDELRKLYEQRVSSAATAAPSL